MVKRYAKVVAGIVENISIADSPADAPGCVEMDDVLDAEIGIGDVYSGGKFSKVPPPPKTTAEKRKDIERQRDAALVAGFSYGGKLYPCDDVMIAAITGRIVRWREGRIPVDAKLPVRLKNNTIEMHTLAEHLDLADALANHGESVYAASWAAKDAL